MLARRQRLSRWTSASISLVAVIVLKPVLTGAIYLACYLVLALDTAPLRALPVLAILGPGATALIVWAFRRAAGALPRVGLATLLALDLMRWLSAYLGTALVVPPIVALVMPTLFMIVAWLLIALGQAAPATAAAPPTYPPWMPRPHAQTEQLWQHRDPTPRPTPQRLRLIPVVAMVGVLALLGPPLVYQAARSIIAAMRELQTPGYPLRSLRGRAVTVVAWSPDGARLAATGNTKTIDVIDPIADRTSFTFAIDPGLVDPVAWNQVVWRPQGDMIAARLGTATQFIDAQDGQLLRTATFEPGGLAGIQWSPDGRWLAVADRDHGYPILLDPHDPQADQPIAGLRAAASSFAWSPDSRYLAIGEDRDVAIVESATGRIVTRLATDLDFPVVAWSPDGIWIAVHGWYGAGVQIWDAATFQRQTGAIGQFTDVLSIAWHPTGKLLAIELKDGTIQIWEPSGGAPRDTLPQQTDPDGPRVELAWSADGRWLAAADAMNIYLWDSRSATAQTQPGHTSAIQTLAWSPTHPWLITGDTRETIRLLKLEP